MASEGASIRIDVDPKKAVEGIEDVSDAVDKITENLDQVGKDGVKDVDKLEKSISDLNREALKTGDEFEKSVGKKFKNSTKEAESGLQDFKQEAHSTAKESAASFDGSAESIVDSFQEIAANAFEGFGPAGAMAGLALAAGIGLATAAFGQSQEEAQKAKERISELATALIDAGSTDVNFDLVIERLKEMATTTEDGAVNLEKLQKVADKSGGSFDELAQAYAGNSEGLGELISEMEKENALTEKQTEGRHMGTSALDELTNAQSEYITLLKTSQEEIAKAEAQEKLWRDSGGPEMQAKAEAISMINGAYDEVVNSVTDYVNKETGVLDVEAYITAMQARSDALNAYQTNLANSGFTTEQKSALDAMGYEAAAAWMQGYESATPEQKASMEKFLTESAKDSSGLAKGEIDKTFMTPTEAKVQAKLDEESKKEVQRALNQITAAATVTVKYVDKYGKPVD